MADPLDTSDTLLRAGEVAKRLNAAVATVYEWSRSNPERYGAVRVGPRAVRFRRAAIDKLISGDGVHDRA